jgi:hypothetical protein
MITIDQAIHILSHYLVSEFYLPEEYWYIPDIQHLIQQHNWNMIPSEARGWVMLRKRMVYQD